MPSIAVAIAPTIAAVAVTFAVVPSIAVALVVIALPLRCCCTVHCHFS
jgi:hypothetical protein